jgi:DNA-binding CsgD family transcriptional regulator
MPDLPTDGVRIAAEIAQIAAAPGSVEERAEALVEPLHRLVPFEGVLIRLLDPGHEPPMLALHRGYDRRTETYCTSPASSDEIELLGFTRQRTALRNADLPVPVEQLQGWTEYLRPAGFRENLGVGLFHPDGRYLGVLALSTDTVAHPTEAARDLLSALAPVIATAIDPLRSIAAVAALVSDSYAGIMLARSGKPLPLPGLPGHDLLTDRSEVLRAVAERVTGGQVHGSFLWPDPASQTGRPILITMLACPADSPGSLLAIVLLSPPGELRNLTPRELEILGLLVEGWSNPRICAALFLAPRTVATHVEHILAKLGASTRTLAAVRAQRLGLYIPRPLNGTHEESRHDPTRVRRAPRHRRLE